LYFSVTWGTQSIISITRFPSFASARAINHFSRDLFIRKVSEQKVTC